MRARFLFFLLLPFAHLAANVSYQVDFEGLDDRGALKEMKRVSALTSLQKRPPSSIHALRYRAESDLPSLVKVLEAHGYYEGKVTAQIYEAYGQVSVVVRINPGPRYELEAFDIEYRERGDPPCAIDLEEVGINLHQPIQTDSILQGELKILSRLSECGFPLSKIEERKIVVDGKTKSARVTLVIALGERVNFGPTSIEGNGGVKKRFIERKMGWKEGELYDSRLVEKAQTALIDTGLFSSVLITHEQSPSSKAELPLKIELSETKHQNVSLGVSYQTVFGPGLALGWENRNIGGQGRVLGFQAEVTRISQTGVARYIHPDFNRIGQTMIAQAEASHEDIYAYTKRAYGVMERFERIYTSHFRGSLGFRGERLLVTDSVHNGNYWLLQLPLYLRLSSANDLLNPTRGATLEYTTTPAFNHANLSHFYLTQELTGSLYKAFDEKKRILLAQKLTLGSIVSNGLNATPLCNRFLGGTEADLRGYRYRSVSPLEGGKPIGGRGALYYSAEVRFRVSEHLGLVPFFDAGTVTTDEFPTIKGQWYKSIGVGARFFTFMGPFRVDLAFPLDRREEIDPRYKVLVSIGQMF